MSDRQPARFHLEQGTRILVQVPEEDAQRILSAILTKVPLQWGDYDQVAFTTSIGVQQFRSLGAGVNVMTDAAVQVNCVELQVFVPQRGAALEPVLRAVYDMHPYEEPVIQLLEATRSLHIRGVDEDNPNRFWNRSTADWVPDVHRRDLIGPGESA